MVGMVSRVRVWLYLSINTVEGNRQKVFWSSSHCITKHKKYLLRLGNVVCFCWCHWLFRWVFLVFFFLQGELTCLAKKNNNKKIKIFQNACWPAYPELKRTKPEMWYKYYKNIWSNHTLIFLSKLIAFLLNRFVYRSPATTINKGECTLVMELKKKKKKEKKRKKRNLLGGSRSSEDYFGSDQ